MEKKLIRKLKNICLSLIFAVFGFFMGIQERFGVKGGVVFAYMGWSWFWGLKLLWPRYVERAKYKKHAISKKGLLNKILSIDAFLMKFTYPIFLFPVYTTWALGVGIFGGGIYKFIKYMKDE